MPTKWTDDPLEPYRQAQAEQGAAFGVTLWNSEASQRKRFRVFREMVFLEGKRVLDAGCSRGDLAAYLLEHEVRYGHYVGVDGIAEVIGFAEKRGLPDTTFVAADLLAEPEVLLAQRPQVVLLSGTLNTMDEPTAQRLLASCWEACSETLAFNFLSDLAGPDAPPQDYPATRLPTVRLLEWAAREARGNVILRQDYFRYGHDATIVMRRD
ncbi:class I SAM-dependent methyltransferase [Mucisphaera sp.]|uniref:class I SAM-dependent methyltransferase n=1 Tax=Mucisphaera sp. TaxID=2913024 RepID=UPI003D0B2119